MTALDAEHGRDSLCVVSRNEQTLHLGAQSPPVSGAKDRRMFQKSCCGNVLNMQ